MKSTDISSVIQPSIIQNLDIFLCPVCNGAIKVSADRYMLECSVCGQSFKCDSGIPLLFWTHDWSSDKKDVTNIVKSFYEETPFPNYEDVDSISSLREKAEKSVFAHMLDDQLPYNLKILEVGCGTGQLSNFLGIIKERTVFGTDMCLNSLRLGHEFSEKNNLNNVSFLQMNLFRPVFKPDSFDVVICNGVLHHTGDPFRGFQSILKLVKKRGFIIIGLYHTYGRIITDIRRFIFRFFGNSFKFLDPRLRDQSLSNEKRHTWFMDQYKHPHESKHSIGEVLHWFDKCEIEFINSVPKDRAFETFSHQEKLFTANQRGSWFDHFVVQTGMVFSGSKEGGFFTMIGRKK